MDDSMFVRPGLLIGWSQVSVGIGRSPVDGASLVRKESSCLFCLLREISF